MSDCVSKQHFVIDLKITMACYTKDCCISLPRIASVGIVGPYFFEENNVTVTALTILSKIFKGHNSNILSLKNTVVSARWKYSIHSLKIIESVMRNVNSLANLVGWQTHFPGKLPLIIFFMPMRLIQECILINPKFLIPLRLLFSKR